MRYKDMIDITLSDEDAVAIEAALMTLEEKFSFLIGLRKSDIRRMAKMGLRSETFVMAAIEAGKNNPNLLPPNISLPAIERDRISREKLTQYSQRVQQLNEKLIHTRWALGSDLYGAARAIYKALQEFGRDSGLGDLLEELGRRFKSRKATSDTTPPATGGAGV